MGVGGTLKGTKDLFPLPRPPQLRGDWQVAPCRQLSLQRGGETQTPNTKERVRWAAWPRIEGSAQSRGALPG